MAYKIAVCTVKNSWWWTEELSKTCRVSFQNKLDKLVHLVGFYYKTFITIHSHMNFKSTWLYWYLNTRSSFHEYNADMWHAYSGPCCGTSCQLRDSNHWDVGSVRGTSLLYLWYKSALLGWPPHTYLFPINIIPPLFPAPAFICFRRYINIVIETSINSTHKILWIP
jgi:hypothetical protein